MNFLKRLFGGGGASATNREFVVFVLPRGCEEVVRVRIDLYNDLSLDDEGGGYTVRKTARGTYRCFNPAEVTLRFSADRKPLDQTITSGVFVDEDAYLAWEATLAARRSAQNAPAQDE